MDVLCRESGTNALALFRWAGRESKGRENELEKEGVEVEERFHSLYALAKESFVQKMGV